jgi:outer membrane cobalamin receptor
MKNRIATLLFSGAGAAILSQPPAQAQSAPETREGLEEITVTARRREESLQEAPLSITAFGSEQIERAGIAGFGDVAKLTPSLVFDQDFGANDTRPSIRGLPATRGRPPVGILIDGIDVSSEAIATAGGGNLLNLRLLDLERIEVVKGPQSALYGRVAFGGAVNYVTARATVTSSAARSAARSVKAVCAHASTAATRVPTASIATSSPARTSAGTKRSKSRCPSTTAAATTSPCAASSRGAISRSSSSPITNTPPSTIRRRCCLCRPASRGSVSAT